MNFKTKLNILVIILSCLVTNTYSQNILDTLKNGEIVNFNKTDINSLLTNNVIKYYKIKDINSSLEIAAYKKTEDYSQKLNQMKNDKDKLYYIKIPFYEHNGWWHVPDYNFKTKGYDIWLGRNVNYTPTNTPEKCYDNYGTTLRFSQLKTFKQPSAYKGSYYEYFNILIDENDGLKMEKDKNNLYFYFIFRLIDIKNLKYNFCRVGSMINLTEEVVDTKNLRILIANDELKTIFKDKTY